MLFKGVAMPAKKMISKESIIQAALQIVRKDGMEGLNMRSLAKACNCSTQPIYLSFSGAEEVKAEVHARIIAEYENCIKSELASGKYPGYKATGMGYIRFAKEQPELFKYMFMRDRGGVPTMDEESGFNDEVYKLMQNMGLYQDKAVALHTHMWVWVHGIATMYATGYLNWDWETVSAMLTDAFFGIKARLDIK